MRVCGGKLAFVTSMGSASAHISSFFFFNDTATTEIYTLSLHDALPISARARPAPSRASRRAGPVPPGRTPPSRMRRSEEHTSELQSPCNLVCRLLLEKKKQACRHNRHATGTEHHSQPPERRPRSDVQPR